MNRPASEPEGPPFELVDVIRDFLAAHRRLEQLFAAAHGGRLRFAEVRDLVGDGRESLLFRLKERCHALFRVRVAGTGLETPRQALFDLAVGSLFHETMKLRENLYQQEVYGPQVRALRDRAAPESRALIADFEKLLSGAGERAAEALRESEALLGHTRAQFRLLLMDLQSEPLIARTLVAQRTSVETVFRDGLDALLGDVYGSPAEGWIAAARSWLRSACFAEALEALAEAERRIPAHEGLSRLRAYAEGMEAFRAGDYERSLERLEQWVGAGPGPDEAEAVGLARAVLPRLSRLVDRAAHREWLQRARRLVEALPAWPSDAETPPVPDPRGDREGPPGTPDPAPGAGRSAAGGTGPEADAPPPAAVASGAKGGARRRS